MIHERLKARGLSVARDKLTDVLDFMVSLGEGGGGGGGEGDKPS